MSPKRYIVGVADCRVTNEPKAALATYSLGSCVAVVIHDAVVGVGGLLHLMLPDSRLDPARAAENPFVFADTGLPRLFRHAYALGAEKRRLDVKLIGGVSTGRFEYGMNSIGMKNAEAVKRILKHAAVPIALEAVGGGRPRDVVLEIGTGACLIR